MVVVKLQEMGFKEFLENLTDRVRIRVIEKLAKECIITYNIVGRR
jgi:hypothetical protein